MDQQRSGMPYQSDSRGLAPFEEINVKPPQHQDYLEALEKWETPVKGPPKRKPVTRNHQGLPLISKSVQRAAKERTNDKSPFAKLKDGSIQQPKFQADFSNKKNHYPSGDQFVKNYFNKNKFSLPNGNNQLDDRMINSRYRLHNFDIQGSNSIKQQRHNSSLTEQRQSLPRQPASTVPKQTNYLPQLQPLNSTLHQPNKIKLKPQFPPQYNQVLPQPLRYNNPLQNISYLPQQLNPIFEHVRKPNSYLSDQNEHLRFLNQSIDVVNHKYRAPQKKNYYREDRGAITEDQGGLLRNSLNKRSRSQLSNTKLPRKRYKKRRKVSKKYMMRDNSSDSFFDYGRSNKKYHDYLSQDEDYDYQSRVEGLLRPISKRDLYEAFNSYRMLVGEEVEKVDNLSRLYAPNKFKKMAKEEERNVKQEVYNIQVTKNSNNASTYNLLKERGYNSLEPDEAPTPSPPIANFENNDFQEGQPLYEARKYLKEVVVTFKGLKREKLWN